MNSQKSQATLLDLRHPVAGRSDPMIPSSVESSQLHPENAHGESASAYLALEYHSFSPTHNYFNRCRQKLHIDNIYKYNVL